jgi:DUF4097 and DUF4098 domain-containing protein YvlB
MRAKPFLLAPAVAAAVLSLAGCDMDFGPSERFSRDFHNSYPLKAGGRVSVETFNGSVEISGWDQETVDISGTKYGPTQEEADALKVNIDNTPDAVSIRVVRPSERRNNLGARLAIKIPRGAVLDRITASNGAIRTRDGSGPARLKTSNGQIRVESLRGSLEAQTSNGSVELADIAGDATVHSSNGRIRADRVEGALDATTSNSGVTAALEKVNRPVRIETSNGGVELTMPAEYSSDVRVSTSNGGITLHLPTGANANVMARTSNSSITSDFEVRMRGEITKNRLEGAIGNGGPLLDLSTSNGGIRLLKM